MCIRFPIQTPKEYITARKIMKSVEQNTIKPMQKIKQQRYQWNRNDHQIFSTNKLQGKKEGETEPID